MPCLKGAMEPCALSPPLRLKGPTPALCTERWVSEEGTESPPKCYLYCYKPGNPRAGGPGNHSAEAGLVLKGRRLRREGEIGRNGIAGLIILKVASRGKQHRL